jgi:hypothetical protein
MPDLPCRCTICNRSQGSAANGEDGFCDYCRNVVTYVAPKHQCRPRDVGCRPRSDEEYFALCKSILEGNGRA